MDKPYAVCDNTRPCDNDVSTKPDGEVRFIGCDEICPDPMRPPRKYPDQELSAIAAGFLKRGIGVPIVVMQAKWLGKSRFVLISGEKIFRAALIAGIRRLPCEVLVSEEPKDASVNVDDSFAAAPPAAKEKIVIGDLRFFFNSVDHAVKLMNRSGVSVVCGREETADATVITITVPKSPPI